MKQIWKYSLRTIDRQTLQVPAGAKILTVQVQRGEPYLWALVDPAADHPSNINIAVFGTGHNIPDDIGEYIGTFQLLNSELIFHVFKERMI